MHLRAEHCDGFTEHHLHWVLVASNGSAIVEASWLSRSERVNRAFEMAFPESRIERCAEALAKLRPEYDGHVDDFPTYKLSATDGDRTLSTKVRAGIHWPQEDKSAIEVFMGVWTPLYLEVEQQLAIPGHS